MGPTVVWSLAPKALKTQWKHPIQVLFTGFLSVGFEHKSLGAERGGIEGEDTCWFSVSFPLSSSEAVSGICDPASATLLWTDLFPRRFLGFVHSKHSLYRSCGLLHFRPSNSYSSHQDPFSLCLDDSSRQMKENQIGECLQCRPAESHVRTPPGSSTSPPVLLPLLSPPLSLH